MKIQSLLIFGLWGLLGFHTSLDAQPQVIAHRGYWQCDGSAQNSLASLKAADRIGAFGSECDIYLCADGELMVFHDPDITIDRQKISLENSSSAILKNYPLKNGETMPSFDQYLATLKQCRTTRLIIELKSIALTEARQTELARKTLDKVRQAGLEDRVEYIAFSLYLCQELHRLDPQAQVAYLNGDLSPRQIKKRGLTGLDYHMDVFRSHPRWIRQARKLGLRTNVWTVNETDDLRYFIDQQVDYISTDQPERLQRLLKERLSQ